MDGGQQVVQGGYATKCVDIYFKNKYIRHRKEQEEKLDYKLNY
jgi:hypothetical protein